MNLFKSCIVAATIFATISSASAQTTYTHEIPKLYPTVYSLWGKSLASHHPSAPEGQRPTTKKWDSWLTGLQGVGSPLADVTIGNAHYKFGTICMPHACGDNIAGVLFTDDQTRVIGVVNLGEVPTPLGPMSQAEYLCIRQFIADQGSPTACH